MHYSLDGSGLSREQLQAKAEAEAAAIAGQLDGGPHPGDPASNSSCEWRGDAPEPELDDLAHPHEQPHQSSRPANACDWRGDEPDPLEDDLGPICQPEDQSRQPNRLDEQGKEANSYQMPIPRLSKVAGISGTRSYLLALNCSPLPNQLLEFPSANDESTAQNHDPVSLSGVSSQSLSGFEIN